MKLLALLFCMTTLSVFAQRDLLNSNLSEYGTKMQYKEAWTDDEYIILVAEGMVNKKKANVFLVVHPDQGIIASHIVERESMHTYSGIIFTNAEELTVFYRMLVKNKRQNYRLSFSKITKQIAVSEIDDQIERIEKESVFSFLHEGRLLFASITKEKDKVGFRQMNSEGQAIVTHIFEMPDTLWQYINTKKSNFSRKSLDRTAYLSGNSVRAIGYEGKNKRFTAHIFDFNLETQKITINSFTQEDKYKSHLLAFAGDNMFFLKIASGSSQLPEYKMDLEILEYPTFRQLKFFTTSLSSLQIPYKTSKVWNVSFKSGLYFSGRNRKFTQPVEENVSTIKLLSRLSAGEPFMSIRQKDSDLQLTIGSREDLLVTNTVMTNIYYFFGCIDNDFNPCPSSKNLASEKIIEYLETIREEKPDFLEFGHKKAFAVFNLYAKDQITLMEF
jgi:hypothetical protein